MINLRDKLQSYNYTISHIAGKRNNIADSLSRTPSWFTKDEAFKSSYNINVEEGVIRFLTTVDSELDTEVVRTVQEIPDIFDRDNPGLERIEGLGRDDPEEMLLLKCTGTAQKNIPQNSEASKMGGEWPHISILQHWEILILKDSSQERIIPPKSYRETIIATLHSTGRKSATLMETIKRHYYWP